MKVRISHFKTYVILVLSLAVAKASAQKEDMFNPVNTSVTSQTIAPDARSAGLGDVGAATDPDVHNLEGRRGTQLHSLAQTVGQ